MPLYEYKCDVCGASFEVIQRFSDKPIEACRVCAGPVHKVLSAPAIHFKGSGWYVTDYAKKGTVDAGKRADDKAAAAADSTKSDSSKADSSKTDSSKPSSTPPSSSSSSSEKKA